MEIAAGLYDTSLSWESRRAAEGVRQTDSRVAQAKFHGLRKDVPTLDFSGWPMIVHADMPDKVAYALCEAIESRKQMIPTDNYKPLRIAQLCAGDAEAPYDAPFHAGAKRFYRERGYLK